VPSIDDSLGRLAASAAANSCGLTATKPARLLLPLLLLIEASSLLLSVPLLLVKLVLLLILLRLLME
jgi:hypothetical protein